MEPQRTIRRFMLEKNITQRDLSRAFVEHALGAPRQRVSNYVHGRSCPTPEGAMVLCHALGLNARECLELYEACGIPTPDPVWTVVHEVP
jgi:plasmid maintenance system antidote protein VapI